MPPPTAPGLTAKKHPEMHVHLIAWFFLEAKNFPSCNGAHPPKVLPAVQEVKPFLARGHSRLLVIVMQISTISAMPCAPAVMSSQAGISCVYAWALVFASHPKCG